MKAYSKTLISELERQLQLIHSENSEPILYSEKAIKVLITILEELKTKFCTHDFQSKSEEIEFFKLLKPQFTYRLIYYNEIFTIESNKPYGSEKTLRKFFNNELDKLKDFFDENLDFYKYYRIGSTHLDKKYFIRGKHDIRLTLDSFYFQADHRFTTSHDYKVARIMANDLLQVYLENELSKIRRKNPEQVSSKGLQKWTGSKVSLIELIYALHSEGVFNNGASELKDLTGFFESAFEINLGQYHRTFLDIRSRKSERTKFLNSLREKLLSRMDDADEVA